MANEIELKLCLTAEGLEHLRTVWLPAFSDAPIRTTQLRNTYFDTPELALHERRVALRLREKNGRIIQTLKTQGQSHGGLHQRDEWEWEIPQPRLDGDLLRQVAFPPEVAVTALQPMFTTDFARTQVDIIIDESVIELALDQGEVRANGRVTRILELELELKRGTTDSLFALARKIASQVPVWASDISKAERGYGLAGVGVADESAARVLTQAMPGSVVRLREQSHRRWLHAIEDFRGAPSFAALLAVDRALAALRAAVEDVVTEGEMVAREDRATLLSALEVEQTRMAGLLAEFATQGEKNSLAQFEVSPSAGLLTLEMSRYLIARPAPASSAET